MVVVSPFQPGRSWACTSAGAVTITSHQPATTSTPNYSGRCIGPLFRYFACPFWALRLGIRAKHADLRWTLLLVVTYLLCRCQVRDTFFFALANGSVWVDDPLKLNNMCPPPAV